MKHPNANPTNIQKKNLTQCGKLKNLNIDIMNVAQISTQIQRLVSYIKTIIMDVNFTLQQQPKNGKYTRLNTLNKF